MNKYDLAKVKLEPNLSNTFAKQKVVFEYVSGFIFTSI